MCDTVYYKLRQVLQSAMDLLQIATGITKCDDYYKLRQYRGYFWEFLVGVCSPVLQILTLFQTEKCHFPDPFSDLAFRQKLC